MQKIDKHVYTIILYNDHILNNDDVKTILYKFIRYVHRKFHRQPVNKHNFIMNTVMSQHDRLLLNNVLDNILSHVLSNLVIDYILNVEVSCSYVHINFSRQLQFNIDTHCTQIIKINWYGSTPWNIRFLPYYDTCTFGNQCKYYLVHTLLADIIKKID